MSHSPEEAEGVSGSSYESGWIAIHRMLRGGASWSGRERHCAFLGTGTGEFVDASAVTGLDFQEDGRAAIVTDWDGDGAQDIWLFSRTGPRLRLMRNTFASGGPALQIKLEDSGANGDAIGARLDLELADGRVLARSVRAGSGYLAQSSLWSHFGLTSAAAPVSLTVRWPDGETEKFTELELGRWRLRRGEGLRKADATSQASALTAGELEPVEVESAERLAVGVRLPMPDLRATVSGGIPRELLTAYPNRPLLVLPWASWCAPCLEELSNLADDREKLRGTGLTIIALNADQDKAGQRAAQRFLREIAWPFEVASADRDLIDVLDLVQQHVLERRRRLPLPSSFLIDAEGRLAVVTKGALSTKRLILDVIGLQSDAVRVRNSSVPFRGRWRGVPLEPDTLGLVARLRKAGFKEVAQSYYTRWFMGAVEADVGAAKTHLQFGLVMMRQRLLDDAEKHLRAAVELDKSLLDAWANLAAVLHRKGKRAEAIEAYDKALALDGKHVQSLFNLGLALAEAGQFERAREQAAKLDKLPGELGERLRGEIKKLE